MAAKIVDRFPDILGNALESLEVWWIRNTSLSEAASKAGQPLIDAVKKYYQRCIFFPVKIPMYWQSWTMMREFTELQNW